MAGPRPDGLVMRSPAMATVERVARLYATVPNPAVLVGPVGSGKTTLARWIHRASGRTGRFVRIGSGDLGAAFFLDTLFGHVPGAFTDAKGRRGGLLAKASNGTVLIDDLALLAPAVQGALLTVVEERSYRPAGSDDELEASCRFLFAATGDPRDLVAKGQLLPDLVSRIGEFKITVPPLAERVEDIMPIALLRARRAISTMLWDVVPEFDAPTVNSLTAYSWPQNVREPESVIDVAVAHAGVHDGAVIIRRTHLPERFQAVAAQGSVRQRLSRTAVGAMLCETKGNKSEAARRMKVHRNSIRKYAPPAP